MQPRDAWALLGLGGLLLFKIVVVWQLKDAPTVGPQVGLDTAAYHQLARRVLDGDIGLGPGLYYVSPFYIYFLAAALAVTKSLTGVRLVQVLLGTLAVGAIGLTTREWFGRRAAWVAMALAAATGLFTFYEALILQTSVDVAFTAAGLLCLTLGLRRGAWPWFLSAGVVFGLQTLNRPNIALSTAAVILVAALVLRRRALAGVLAAGFLIGLAPATLRNAVVAHEFSLVSSHGGLNFYIGNNPNATGFYQPVPGIRPTIIGQEDDVRKVAGAALGRAVTDAEASDYFVDLALAWARANPGVAAWFFIRKVGLTLHAQHVPLPYSYPFYQYDWPTWLRFAVVGPWLLVPLGLLGLVFAAPNAREERDAYLVWAAFVPAYTCAVALFFVSERYRLPLLVPFACAAGGLVDWCVVSIRARRFGAVGAVAAAAVSLGVAVTIHPSVADGRWDEGLRLVQLYAAAKDDAAIARWMPHLRAAERHKGDSDQGLGLQWLALGEPARAVGPLRAALAADPTQTTTAYALGRALLRSGDAAGAVPYLQQGYDAHAPLTMGAYDLAEALKTTGHDEAARGVLASLAMDRDAGIDDWLAAGRLANDLHAPEIGRPFFAGAVERWPDNVDARLQYGVNLNILGRFNDAATALGAAVRLDARNAGAHAQYAYALAKLGQTDAARREATAALTLDPDEPLAAQVLRAVK